MKVYKTLKFNNLSKIFIFCFILFLLFGFSKQNYESAKNTINIFLFSVMPSLFPFMLFTEIILKTDVIDTISEIFGKFIYKVFKLNKNCTASFIIGFLCGYPMGAKAVINSLENNKITHNEALILLNFINNCNPIFIISTISLTLFNNVKIGIILLFSHILAALLLGIISSKKYNNNIILKNSEFLNSFDKKSYINEKTTIFEIIKNGLLNVFITLEIILGFMLLFNMLSNIFVNIGETLNLPTTLLQILTGFFEVTGGCFNINNLNLSLDIKLILISFVLGFSGLCIIFQIYSVIYKYKFSLKRLVIFKLLHGIISAIITYILLSIININEVSIKTFSNISTNDFSNTNNLSSIVPIYLFEIFIVFIFFLLFFKLKKATKK